MDKEKVVTSPLATSNWLKTKFQAYSYKWRKRLMHKEVVV